MNYGVQFSDSRGPGCIRAEGCFGELRAVDGAVGIQDGLAKMADDFIVDRLARLHELVGDVVGLDQARAQSDQHFADHGLTAGDPAG